MRSVSSLFWVLNYTPLGWLLTASIRYIEDIRVNTGYFRCMPYNLSLEF